MADKPEGMVLTPTSRHLLRLAWSIGIGVPVGLAPLLGTKVIPGFQPLLTVLSRDLRTQAIPYSIFIVTIVALGLEFYVHERIKKGTLRSTLRWIFPVGLVTLVVLLSMLVRLQSRYIVPVPLAGGHTTPILIGSSRLPAPGCDCEGLTDVACVQQISVNPAAIHSCWDRTELQAIGFRLLRNYLLLMGVLLALIGLVVLKVEAGPREGDASPQPSPPAKGAPS